MFKRYDIEDLVIWYNFAMKLFVEASIGRLFVTVKYLTYICDRPKIWQDHFELYTSINEKPMIHLL